MTASPSSDVPGSPSWSPQPEVPALAVPELLQDPARHGHDVDLVGTVVDAGEPSRAVHPLQREVPGDTGSPEHLDGAVDHVVEHRGAHHLDYPDLHPGRVALVDLVGRLQGEQ